jgi:hypothetical protein
MKPAANLGVWAALAAIASCFVGGCGSYMTPGKPADFRALGISAEQAAAQTDASIEAKLQLKPLASFPTDIACVRMQDFSYSRFSNAAYGSGDYAVMPVREGGSQEAFDTLAALPMVRSIVPLNRLVVDPNIKTHEDIRQSAAAVHCDMILVYTFDTRFGSETTVPYLGTITLGFFPNQQARVTCTASAALLDTRNGYIYGLAEATYKTEQIANTWTTTDAIEQSRRRAESKALQALADEVGKLWVRVVARYGPPPQPQPISQPTP